MDLVAIAWLTGVMVVLTVLCGRTIRFVNSSSHQALYGNRLTRAYLGASNRNRFTSEGGQRLSRSHSGRQHRLGRVRAVRRRWPAASRQRHAQRDRPRRLADRAARSQRACRWRSGRAGSVPGSRATRCGSSGSDDPASRTVADWEGRLPGPSTDWVKPIAPVGPGLPPVCLATAGAARGRSAERRDRGRRSPARRSRPGSAPAPAWPRRCCSASPTCGSGTGGTRTSSRTNAHGVRTMPTIRNRIGERRQRLVPGAGAPDPGVHGALLRAQPASGGT